MSPFTESVVEDAALAWLDGIGWAVAHGPDIAPDTLLSERANYGQVVLDERLRKALTRLNPDLPSGALNDVFRKLTRPVGATLEASNRAFHRMLVDGVTVEFRTAAGTIRGAQARVIDFDEHDQNDWLAVNQFTVTENRHTRRPDIVLFVNGLPLGVVELKNAADEDATIWTAWHQLQTYKAELPALFSMNELLLVSDGDLARVGTLTAGKEWFKPWRTVSGESLAGTHLTELQVTIEGLLEHQRFLDLVRHFIVFEDEGGGNINKKMAGYHQFHAVEVAIAETLRASEGPAVEGGSAPFYPLAREPLPEERYRGCVPMVGLKAAAGAFGDPQTIQDDGFDWVGLETSMSLRQGMFVAQVVGRSMEPGIPDGAWCLFSAPVEGTRQGKPVLVQLRDEVDPETGERYTVKRYESEKRVEDGALVHARITLRADNPAFEPILLTPEDEGQVQVVAEMVEVLGAGRAKEDGAGDRRVGVVWHTQGAGKSLTMAFYAGRVICEPDMANPTLVILTDRNDLDDQLFGTFSRCSELLRQPPVQAENREDLRRRLSVEAGGVVFTTIQKFFPEEKGDRHPVLSERGNIVVIADEAHRSQYDFIDGFARHMRDALPHASFIGFTATPIEKTDRNTRAVFGENISVYDIQRAVDDGATVPIYYESRLAKLELDESEKPKIDPAFEEVTEGEEIDRKERLKTKWAQLESLVGSERRLDLVAEDLVHHYESRCEAMEGKAMVVCMSRRICVELYKRIVALRPDWDASEDEEGVVKVVMTGSAPDPLDWQPHIRNKKRREALAKRFRNHADPLRIVLVRDMWLTGFDAPALHTMYVDKPMRGHGLMQAIARVNRVFRDKPGGLVVDYIGIAPELKSALATYTASGGKGATAVDQEQAVMVMVEKYEVCCGLFHGFDRAAWVSGTPQERLSLLPAAQEHILAQQDGKDRLVAAVRALSQAFALSVPHQRTIEIRDEVGFFQAVKAVLIKRSEDDVRPQEDLNLAVREIVARAVAPGGVVDIFKAAGLAKPDISILSDEFLAEVQGMPHKNLAVELLKKLLRGEIKTRHRKNTVKARSFAEMLEQTVRRYQNRAIEAAQVIEELIALAKEMRAAEKRGEELGLSEDELAFYDALETNDSAVAVLGDVTLQEIAKELVEKVRGNVTIDWTLRESVRAKLRVLVKRILRKHGYPPDKREQATKTVLEQAEVLSEEWAAA